MQNCYNTGDRVPREKQFDQDERLTNKHIQTLQFVQDVVKENKELKKKVEELELKQLHCDELHPLAAEAQERIKTIQEQYLKRADEINAMMAEKHRVEMMQSVQEKLEQEQKYCDQICELKGEISGLERTNQEMLGRVELLTAAQEKVEILNRDIDELKKRISDLETEIETLKIEKSHLADEKSCQFSQIQNLQELRHKNDSLSQELHSVTYKNTELTHKVRKLELDLKEATLAPDHTELIDNLKNKLAKIHKEKSVAAEKEAFYERMISELKYELQTLRESLNREEVTKERVLVEYYKVQAELQHLRKRLSSENQEKTFKDFVKLKREVAFLKEENLELKQGVKGSTSGSVLSLPVLRYEPATPAVKADGDKKKKQLSIKSK